VIAELQEGKMRKVLAVLAAALTIAACPKQQPETDSSLSPKVTIVVNNNFTPPAQFTVYIVSQSGFRQTLGNVSPGQKMSFSYQPTNATDKFTLIGQGNGGRKMSSQTFTLINATSVTWDMSTNMTQTFEN
jgi:hypothetical protein